MADDLALVAHRQMRLVVEIGLVAPLGGIDAARRRLDIKVMRLLATLLDEIAREVEIALLAGGATEPDQRELDLLMPAIAGLLAELRPEVASIWSA